MLLSELSRTEDVAVTEKDIAVIEAVLKQIDHKNTIREVLAYWKLAMKLFKQFDLGFTCLPERSNIEEGHRAILESMVTVTDWVVEQSGCLTPDELAELNLSPDALRVNLRFLRRKFSQWYIPCSDTVLNRTAAAIENGRAVSS